MYKITFCHKGEKTEHSLYLPGDDVYCLTEATLSLEEGKAGELSIGIPDDNTAKKEIVCLTDEIIVYRDSTELFRGRCITEQTDFYLTGTLKVEGILTYLYDTYFPPFEFQGAPLDLLKKVIDNHNSFVDAEKQLRIGTVTVEDPNNYIARSSESYNRTLSILNDKFIGDSLGGYFRVRVTKGIRYLDYLKTYGTKASQTVELGKNILDLAVEVEYSSLITAVLPLGAKSNATDENEKTSYVTVESVNNGDLYIRDRELIKKYGFICECVEWQDVTDPANLKTKAAAYLAQKSFAIETLTIRAVDLYLAGESARPFQLGDMVAVRSAPHGIDQDIELSAMEMDLLNPANDTFTFGAVSGSFTDKSSSDNRNLVDSVSNLTVVVGRISADYITTKTLVAEVAKLGYVTAKEIEAEYIKTKDLEAEYIKTTVADAKYATIENLKASNAEIKDLSADHAEFKDATADNFSALNADIENLNAKKLNATDADLKYANIDFSNIGNAAIEQFYARSGIIKDLVIGDQTITGELVGVTIKGDLIEGNTIVADKLVLRGSDGLYYKLNTDGATVEKEQTDYNSLKGSILQAKSVTAEKINVHDLVAFDATIAGFKITDTALYSGAKDSAINGTRGIYLGKDGQVGFGDGHNYLRYFKATDGTWKLEISAASVEFSSGSSVEDAINDMQERIDQIAEEVTVSLYITSSKGNVFKNTSVSTILSVTIVRGTQRITDSATMKSVFGEGAYLQWLYQGKDDDEFWEIPQEDFRISENGFKFEVSPSDIYTKGVYTCDLIN